MPKVDEESYERANKILESCLTERYHCLDNYERYVEGTQYEALPDFFTADPETPVFERAPKIVYPIVSSAIKSNIDLCLGEDKFPRVSAYIEDDSSSLDMAQAISQDERDVLTTFIDSVITQARLKGVAREALYQAQSTGTCVVIASVRGGKLRVDTTKAKWCSAIFGGPDNNYVEQLTIQYPYLDQIWNPATKRLESRCMLYRRVIDKVSDTTFLPREVEDEDTDVDSMSMTPDTKRVFVHGLGFCPVIWYKHLPQVTTVLEVDGNAIHSHVLDEVDCLNYALSQRHRASMYAGEPQMWETGVDPDENPSELGRRARPVILGDDDKSYYDPAEQMSERDREVRKKGPGVIYRYRNPSARVGILTLPGDAMKSADDNCIDLRSKISEALSVVFIDPDFIQAGTEISGRALGWLHRRQTARCDQYRADFGDNFLIPVINALLRICAVKGPAGGVYVPGIQDALGVISNFLTEAGIDESGWMEPRLVLEWGSYFEPTEIDQKAVIQGCLALLRSGVITRRTAVERIKDFYNIGNIDEYIDELIEDAGLSQIMAASPEGAALADNKLGGSQAVTANGTKLNKVPTKGSVMSGLIEETHRELPEL